MASAGPVAFPEPLLSAALGALGLVLITAAVAKLRSSENGRRSPVKAAALGELALGVLALTGPSRLAAPLLCVTFATFTVAHLRGLATGCGCLGERTSSGPRLSATLTALAAAIAALASLEVPRSTAALLATRPLIGAAVAGSALAGACAWLLVFAGRRPASAPAPAPAPAPARALNAGRPRTASRRHVASERLVNAAAFALERRISRRSALLRVALAGSALAVAPLRYLLYPGSALAAILPGDCAGGLCTDGYTVFCCEINRGSNTCPEGTFPGGWWMCTDYAGGSRRSPSG